MRKLLTAMFVALLMAGCVGQAQKQVQEEAIDLDDPATLDTIIAGAADGEQVFEGDLSSKKPFTHSGWVKNMYDNGQIGSLFQLKDGKMDWSADFVVQERAEEGGRHLQGRQADYCSCLET